MAPTFSHNSAWDSTRSGGRESLRAVLDTDPSKTLPYSYFITLREIKEVKLPGLVAEIGDGTAAFSDDAASGAVALMGSGGTFGPALKNYIDLLKARVDLYYDALVSYSVLAYTDLTYPAETDKQADKIGAQLHKAASDLTAGVQDSTSPIAFVATGGSGGSGVITDWYQAAGQLLNENGCDTGDTWTPNAHGNLIATQLRFIIAKLTTMLSAANLDPATGTSNGHALAFSKDAILATDVLKEAPTGLAADPIISGNPLSGPSGLMSLYLVGQEGATVVVTFTDMNKGTSSDIGGEFAKPMGADQVSQQMHGKVQVQLEAVGTPATFCGAVATKYAVSGETVISVLSEQLDSKGTDSEKAALMNKWGLKVNGGDYTQSLSNTQVFYVGATYQVLVEILGADGTKVVSTKTVVASNSLITASGEAPVVSDPVSGISRENISPGSAGLIQSSADNTASFLLGNGMLAEEYIEAELFQGEGVIRVSMPKSKLLTLMATGPGLTSAKSSIAPGQFVELRLLSRVRKGAVTKSFIDANYSIARLGYLDDLGDPLPETKPDMSMFQATWEGLQGSEASDDTHLVGYIVAGGTTYKAKEAGSTQIPGYDNPSIEVSLHVPAAATGVVAGTIAGVAKGANTTLTCSAAHGLGQGDTITIKDATGAWAALNGEHDVTRVSDTDFAISVDTTNISDTYQAGSASFTCDGVSDIITTVKGTGYQSLLLPDDDLVLNTLLEIKNTLYKPGTTPEFQHQAECSLSTCSSNPSDASTKRATSLIASTLLLVGEGFSGTGQPVSVTTVDADTLKCMVPGDPTAGETLGKQIYVFADVMEAAYTDGSVSIDTNDVKSYVQILSTDINLINDYERTLVLGQPFWREYGALPTVLQVEGEMAGTSSANVLHLFRLGDRGPTEQNAGAGVSTKLYRSGTEVTGASELVDEVKQTYAGGDFTSVVENPATKQEILDDQDGTVRDKYQNSGTKLSEVDEFVDGNTQYLNSNGGQASDSEPVVTVKLSPKTLAYGHDVPKTPVSQTERRRLHQIVSQAAVGSSRRIVDTDYTKLVKVYVMVSLNTANDEDESPVAQGDSSKKNEQLEDLPFFRYYGPADDLASCFTGHNDLKGYVPLVAAKGQVSCSNTGFKIPAGPDVDAALAADASSDLAEKFYCESLVDLVGTNGKAALPFGITVTSTATKEINGVGASTPAGVLMDLRTAQTLNLASTSPGGVITKDISPLFRVTNAGGFGQAQSDRDLDALSDYERTLPAFSGGGTDGASAKNARFVFSTVVGVSSITVGTAYTDSVQTLNTVPQTVGRTYIGRMSSGEPTLTLTQQDVNTQGTWPATLDDKVSSDGYTASVETTYETQSGNDDNSQFVSDTFPVTDTSFTMVRGKARRAKPTVTITDFFNDTLAGLLTGLPEQTGKTYSRSVNKLVLTVEGSFSNSVYALNNATLTPGRVALNLINGNTGQILATPQVGLATNNVMNLDVAPAQLAGLSDADIEGNISAASAPTTITFGTQQGGAFGGAAGGDDIEINAGTLTVTVPVGDPTDVQGDIPAAGTTATGSVAPVLTYSGVSLISGTAASLPSLNAQLAEVFFASGADLQTPDLQPKHGYPQTLSYAEDSILDARTMAADGAFSALQYTATGAGVPLNTARVELPAATSESDRSVSTTPTGLLGKTDTTTDGTTTTQWTDLVGLNSLTSGSAVKAAFAASDGIAVQFENRKAFCEVPALSFIARGYSNVYPNGADTGDTAEFKPHPDSATGSVKIVTTSTCGPSKAPSALDAGVILAAMNNGDGTNYVTYNGDGNQTRLVRLVQQSDFFTDAVLIDGVDNWQFGAGGEQLATAEVTVPAGDDEDAAYRITGAEITYTGVDGAGSDFTGTSGVSITSTGTTHADFPDTSGAKSITFTVKLTSSVYSSEGAAGTGDEQQLKNSLTKLVFDETVDGEKVTTNTRKMSYGQISDISLSANDAIVGIMKNADQEDRALCDVRFKLENDNDPADAENELTRTVAATWEIDYAATPYKKTNWTNGGASTFVAADYLKRAQDNHYWAGNDTSAGEAMMGIGAGAIQQFRNEFFHTISGSATPVTAVERAALGATDGTDSNYLPDKGPVQLSILASNWSAARRRYFMGTTMCPAAPTSNTVYDKSDGNGGFLQAGLTDKVDRIRFGTDIYTVSTVSASVGMRLDEICGEIDDNTNNAPAKEENEGTYILGNAVFGWAYKLTATCTYEQPKGSVTPIAPQASTRIITMANTIDIEVLDLDHLTGTDVIATGKSVGNVRTGSKNPYQYYVDIQPRGCAANTSFVLAEGDNSLGTFDLLALQKILTSAAGMTGAKSSMAIGNSGSDATQPVKVATTNVVVPSIDVAVAIGEVNTETELQQICRIYAEVAQVFAAKLGDIGAQSIYLEAIVLNPALDPNYNGWSALYNSIKEPSGLVTVASIDTALAGGSMSDPQERAAKTIKEILKRKKKSVGSGRVPNTGQADDGKSAVANEEFLVFSSDGCGESEIVFKLGGGTPAQEPANDFVPTGTHKSGGQLRSSA